MTIASKTVLFAGLLLSAALPGPAEAANLYDSWKAGEPGCFARHYDKAHLASHPHQRLTSFSLAKSPPENQPESDTFELSFGFKLKGNRHDFGSAAVCHKLDDVVECWVECDGGTFTMEADGKDLIVRISRMEVEGEEDFSPDLAASDDKVLRLHPAPQKDCDPE